MPAISYQSSGVNRKLADQFVDKIALLSRSTLTNSTLKRRVKSSIGGYASLFELDRNRWLAASTDGVGTKLKLAFELKNHRTVGIDLVAMSVNDLLCVGAEPLFFLDYFATGKLDRQVADQVLEGIVEGCHQAGCALVGGETAEMPGFYAQGEYDLAGFAVGTVNPSHVLPKKTIRPGDILIGISSSGCHSNGYSLIRKLLANRGAQSLPRGLKKEFLTPTRIYTKAVLPLIQNQLVQGLSHITGSGFLNVPRMSEKCSYEIFLPREEERPQVYQWLKKESGLPLSELAQTFNLGIGMVAAVRPDQVQNVLNHLNRSAEKAWIVGEVIRPRAKQGPEVFLHDQSNSVILKYS